MRLGMMRAELTLGFGRGFLLLGRVWMDVDVCTPSAQATGFREGDSRGRGGDSGEGVDNSTRLLIRDCLSS